MSLQPFHLAIPVTDLAESRHFYGTVFGCAEGRSSAQWVDFNFFGHQLVIHLAPLNSAKKELHQNHVDGHGVPVPHFGIVLSWDAWHDLSERLTALKTKFVLALGIRFKGQVGEQATFFLLDPSGNALEFKAFRDMGQLFAS
jgi:extradiol dioxygenase family protein